MTATDNDLLGTLVALREVGGLPSWVDIRVSDSERLVQARFASAGDIPVWLAAFGSSAVVHEERFDHLVYQSATVLDWRSGWTVYLNWRSDTALLAELQAERFGAVPDAA